MQTFIDLSTYFTAISDFPTFLRCAVPSTLYIRAQLLLCVFELAIVAQHAGVGEGMWVRPLTHGRPP